MMKKIFAGLMAAVMSLMTVGCRNQNKDNAAPTEPMEGTVTSTTSTNDAPIDATNEDGNPVSTESGTSAEKTTDDAQNTKAQEETKSNAPASTQNASSDNKKNSETTAPKSTTTSVTTTAPVNTTVVTGEPEDLDQYEEQPVIETEATTEETHDGPVFDEDGSQEL